MLSKRINYLLVFALVVGLTSIAMTNFPITDNQDSAIALTLTGTVTDAETGDPIPNVEVELEELAMTETTDEEGKFEIRDIQEGGIYTIKIDHEGYEPYEETHEVTDQTTQTETDQQQQDQQYMQDEGENEIEIELQPTTQLD
ncbi:MAG: carboxypeptidase-like regulatory domain-containing protein [Balneolaceae bacterium]